MNDKIENLVFWMDELLKLARELQKDLKRFYEPIKGWPPHIEVLEGHTDFDTALESGKQFLAGTPSENLHDAMHEIKNALQDFEATVEGEWSVENASIFASMSAVKLHIDIALDQLKG